MFHPNSSEPDLLKAILEPLLNDFRYWFGRSRALLESETIEFLDPLKQSDLLQRVCEAQEAVQVTQTLMEATDSQVGVDTAVLMTWHQLVTECWQITIRFRLEQSTK